MSTAMCVCVCVCPQTTLAMSILWALTGSMDPRLVPEGKAADVAHDSGGASVKATAEVTLTGVLNGQTFALTRRRNHKKAELHLSIGGVDKTTQAVKVSFQLYLFEA